MRTFFAPIVLARMGGESGDRIGAFGGELIPAIAAPSVPDPPRTTIRSGRRSWLSDLVESHLAEVTVVSRIQPLEPFVVSPNSLVLPVWAIGRSNDLPPSSLDEIGRAHV